MSRRPFLLYILLVLLVAAALRLVDLTRLPPGFSDEEIHQIAIAQSVREGNISTIYTVGDPARGREGLFPILLAAVSGVAGDGLLPMRVLSLCCGLVSVALTYRLTRRLFGDLAGLVAAIALAVSLWPVLLSRSAIRETLLLPLILATLLNMAAAFHLHERIDTEPPGVWRFTLLGALFGVLIYVHWIGLVVVPVFLAFVAYLILTRQPITRRALNFSGFALMIALIVGIPYLTFTLRTPALSGLATFWQERPESIGAWLESVLQVLVSLGFRGDLAPQFNMPGAALLGPGALILLISGVIDSARRWREPNGAFMLIALAFGLAVDMWTRGEPHFPDLTLALPPIMALIGAGAAALSRLVRSLALTYALTLGLTVISALLAADTLVRNWAWRPDVAEAYQARLGRLAIYLDRAERGQSTSICTFALTGESRILEQADPVVLDWMMHRENGDLRFSNCLSGLVLTRGGESQRFAFADPAARREIAPPLMHWLENGQPIPVEGLPLGAVLRIDAAQAVADDFGQLTQSYVEWAPETSGPSAQATLPLRMGGYLTFEGYRLLPPGPYRPGDVITLVTYWRADGPQTPSLHFFAHVARNPNTEPALQNDIVSIDAGRLQDRDVFIQLITLPIPLNFPAGDYSLSVGAYDEQTASRFPIYDENQERGNRLFLDRIAVVQ